MQWYRCGICSVLSKDLFAHDRHIEGQRHKRNEQAVLEGKPLPQTNKRAGKGKSAVKRHKGKSKPSKWARPKKESRAVRRTRRDVKSVAAAIALVDGEERVAIDEAQQKRNPPPKSLATTLVSWSLDQVLGSMPPSSGALLPRKLPLMFDDVHQYVRAFTSLVVEEARETVRQALMTLRAQPQQGILVTVTHAHSLGIQDARDLGRTKTRRLGVTRSTSHLSNPEGDNDELQVVLLAFPSSAQPREGDIGSVGLRSGGGGSSILAVVTGREGKAGVLVQMCMPPAWRSSGSSAAEQSNDMSLVSSTLSEGLTGAELSGLTLVWTPLTSIVTHMRMHAAASRPADQELCALPFLLQLLVADVAQKSIAPALDPPGTHSVTNREQAITDLNPQQRFYASQMADCKAGIRILQGPPGTGKTTTIVCLLQMLARQPNPGSILVCAASNKAVYELCSRFLMQCPHVAVCVVGTESVLQGSEELRRVWSSGWTHWQASRLASYTRILADCQSSGQCAPLPSTEFDQLCGTSEAHTQPTDHTPVATALSNIARLIDVLMQRVPDFFVRVCATHWSQSNGPADALRNLRNLHLPNRSNADPEGEAREGVKESESRAALMSTLVDGLRRLQGVLVAGGAAAGASDQEEQLIQSATIVFATLGTASRPWLHNALRARVLVLDEAAQAAEAETLPVLRACLPRVLLLVGDPQQLPATVLSQEALRLGYGRSLMQRLMDARQYRQKARREKEKKHDARDTPLVPILTSQHRMLPTISALANTLFYSGKLTDAPGVEAQTRPWHTGVQGVLGPLIFMHVDGQMVTGTSGKKTATGSSSNEAEAQLLVWLAENLVGAWGAKQEDICAITFYSAQVSRIQDLLRSRGLSRVRCATVDGFQGSESGVVLLSLVRTKGAGFLKEYRRLNVALTRAKHTLIVCGHARAMKAAGGSLADLVRYIDSRKLLVTEEYGRYQVQKAKRTLSTG